MPVQPPATPAQQQAVQGQASLASSGATNIGNQINVVNSSIDSITNVKNLFESRYSFWDGYIGAYFTEKKYLNGVYQTNPVNSTDFTNLLNKTGRLYSSSDPKPIRIPEFDQNGATSTDSSNELAYLPPESTARNRLTSGFSGPTFPSCLTTTAVTSGTTTVQVENAGKTQMVIPIGIEIIIQSASTACWGTLISAHEVVTSSTPPAPPSTTYYYILTIDIKTTSFGTVNAGATILSSFPGFNNTERTSNTPTQSRYQPIYNNWVSLYKTAVTNWKDNLSQQLTTINGNTAEDQPDVTYVQGLSQAVTTLTNYIAPIQINVSDGGLAPISSLASTRNSSIPARLSYITTRMAETSSYNNRYKYADRLYNQIDGQITMLTSLQNQKAQLAVQQTAANARMAALQAEV